MAEKSYRVNLTVNSETSGADIAEFLESFLEGIHLSSSHTGYDISVGEVEEIIDNKENAQ